MVISKHSEVENPNIHPNNKIDIKDIFKNLTERDDNKIIYLDENDEGNEEEKNDNKEEIHYHKSMNKKKDNRKNITPQKQKVYKETSQHLRRGGQMPAVSGCTLYQSL